MEKSKLTTRLLQQIDTLAAALDARKKIVIPVALAILICIPLLGLSQYVIRILSLICIYSILALSLNLITGYMGQTSMGHAAFYCIGAYISALLTTKTGMSFWIAGILGIIGAGIGGLLLSLSTMRLSGSYLAITTLGFAEVVKMVVLNWHPVTNGPLGVKSIMRPDFFGVPLNTVNGGFYYLALAALILTVLVCYAIVKSKFGRAIVAIKEDVLAAKLIDRKSTRLNSSH